MPIRIVTDSTADLPARLVNEYRIGVAPLNIHFGEEVLKDGVDIWSEEFYNRIKNDPLLPNTSQPSPGEFIEVYKECARPGETIISIHISSEMSGTIGAAKIAAEMLEEEYRIITVDSRSVTMGLGLIVLQAARMAKEGAVLENILAEIRRNVERIRINFTVGSLGYLQRNGRIGKAGAFLGSLLSIKPLLMVKDGVITPLEKVRGNFQKVAEQMIDDLVFRFGDQPLAVSIVHAESPENAGTLRMFAEERLQVAEAFTAVAGPIVGTHTGPSLVGIVALPLT
jgi:DegV family protein with EDD domain